MRKFFAAMLAIIFVILLPIALYGQSIKSTILDQEFYKSELVKYDIYQQVLTEASRQLLSSEAIQSIEEMPLLSADDIKEMLEGIVTPEWLQGNIEMVIDEFFAWFNSDQNIREVKIIISLAGLKEQVITVLNNKIEEKFNSLPECSLQDIEQLSKGFEGELTCRPPGFTIDVLRQYLDLSEFVDVLPDELDVLGVMTGEVSFDKDSEEVSTQAPVDVDEVFRTLTEVRRIVHPAFLILNLLYVLLAVFFVLIVVLVMKSVKSVLRWVGFNLFIPGIILFISGMLLKGLFERYVLAGMHIEEVTTVLVSALQSILQDLFNAIIGVIRIEGVVGLIAGFILIVISFIMKSSQKR